MEFCLNFSVGFTTPPLMLVIRNLVLVHKVKSKEAAPALGLVDGSQKLREAEQIINKQEHFKVKLKEREF